MATLAFISFFDRFSVRPTIKVTGQSELSTWCGLSTSILMVTIVIASLVFFSSNMIYKTNPTYTQFTLNGGMRDKSINISIEDFSVKFGLRTGENYTYINTERFFTIRAFYNNPSTNLDGINMEVCSTDWADPDYNALCISKGQVWNTDFSFNGLQTSSLYFTFEKCTNDTGSSTYDSSSVSSDSYVDLNYSPMQSGGASGICAPGYEIDEMISKSNLFWRVEYSLYSIDPTNFEQPLQKSNNSISIPVNLGQTTSADFNLLAIDFSSDNGWLLSSYSNQQKFAYESITSQLTQTQPSILASIGFQLSQNVIKSQRSYDKLPDVFARVGGIMTPVMLICGLLAIPYAKEKIFEVAVNALYDVRTQPKKRRSPRRNKRKTTKLMTTEISHTECDTKSPIKLEACETNTNIVSNSASAQEHSNTRKSSSLRTKQSTIGSAKLATSKTNKASRYFFSTEVIVNEEDRDKEDKTEDDALDAVVEIDLKEGTSGAKKFDTRTKSDSDSGIERKMTEATVKKHMLSPKLEPKKQNRNIAHSNIAKVRSLPTEAQAPESSKREHQEEPQSQLKQEEQEVKKANKETSYNKRSATGSSVRFLNSHSVKEYPNEEYLADPVNTPMILRSCTNASALTHTYTHSHSAHHLRRSTATIGAKPNILKLGYLQWIKSIFRLAPHKIRAFRILKDRIDDNTDIVTISRRFREIDILKACLLTDDQRALVDNMPRPTVIVKDGDEDSDDSSIDEAEEWIESFHGDTDRVNEAHQKLKRSRHKSELDSKILWLYDHGCHKLDVMKETEQQQQRLKTMTTIV